LIKFLFAEKFTLSFFIDSGHTYIGLSPDIHRFISCDIRPEAQFLSLLSMSWWLQEKNFKFLNKTNMIRRYRGLHCFQRIAIRCFRPFMYAQNNFSCKTLVSTETGQVQTCQLTTAWCRPLHWKTRWV
jgi:hypothetical protein